MKIALLGYGRMGKEIESIAIERGHTISHKIDIENFQSTSNEDLSTADVAINFSTPESAVANIDKGLDSAIPVISGTTAWLDRYDEVVARCQSKNGAFLYASNFSIGVNLFFALNSYLAEQMAPYGQYDCTMEEIHHNRKVDAPSGTAITLAEQILSKLPHKDQWVKALSHEKRDLNIHSKRMGMIPGTHSIQYSSDIDTISIEHVAHNRKGFALGAVTAAEWIIGKKGVFGMSDVLWS